jgi:hypothetical protein
MIKNALLNKYRWFDIDKEQFKDLLASQKYCDNRGEQLNPAQLAELANTLEAELMTLRSIKDDENIRSG